MKFLSGRSIRIHIDRNNNPHRVGLQYILGPIECIINVGCQFILRQNGSIRQDRSHKNLPLLSGGILNTELRAEYRSNTLSGIFPPLFG